MSFAPNGIYPALLTPLKDDLSVDHTKLVNHSKSMIEQGCDGLVLLGTTGEANSFNQSERQEMLKALAAEVDSHKIMVGTGCCSIGESVALTKHALQNGVNNVLVLPPFYYGNISEQGLIRYFDLFVNEVNDDSLRVYLYHFPKMSGVPFTHEAIEKLRESHGEIIAGIKDSSGDWENMSSMCSKFSGFQIFTGNEIYLDSLVKLGGAGTISATINVAAKFAAKTYQESKSVSEGNSQSELTEIRKAFEKYSLIPILKLVMSRIDNDEAWLNIRPPLTPLRFWNEDELKELIDSIS